MKSRIFIFTLLLLVHPLPSWANSAAHYERAISLERSGDLDAAIIEIQSAIHNEPRNASYWATSAHLNFNRGKFVRALQDAEGALRIDKSVGWYFVVAARVSYALGHIEESIQYANQAVAFGQTSLGDANYRTAMEISKSLEPREFSLSWTIPPEKILPQGNRYSVTVAAPPADFPYQKARVTVRNATIVKELDQGGNRSLELIMDSPQNVQLMTMITRDRVDLRNTLENYRPDGSPIPLKPNTIWDRATK